MAKWCDEWGKRIEDETKKEQKELTIKNTGKIDPKRHISEAVEETVNSNILGILGGMISTQSF